MSTYGLTYKLTMCNPKFYTLKFVAISIFMNKKNKIAFSLDIVSLCKKNGFPAITPPKHMQTLLFYRV